MLWWSPRYERGTSGKEGNEGHSPVRSQLYATAKVNRLVSIFHGHGGGLRVVAVCRHDFAPLAVRVAI